MTTVAVVGGGIAGLETARRLQAEHGCAVTLFEKHHHRLGGRAYDVMFQGIGVHHGAGVVLESQKRLLEWLEERGVKDLAFKSGWKTAPCVRPSNDKLDALRRHILTGLTDEERLTRTVAQVARARFGEAWWEEFKASVPYTDFTESDVMDFVEDYPMEDLRVNEPPTTMHNVRWSEDLIPALVSEFVDKGGKLRLDVHVTRVDQQQDGAMFLRFHDVPLGVFDCVVLAVPLTAFDKLEVQGARFSPYDVLRAIPFERAYGHFAQELPLSVSSSAVVTGPPQRKMIGLGNAHVMMISYADSEDANEFQYSLSRLADICGSSLAEQYRMDEVQWKYWRCGTHCYQPRRVDVSRDELLRRHMHFAPRVFLVGEAWSRQQGWVAGCIESVDRLMAHPSFRATLDAARVASAGLRPDT